MYLKILKLLYDYSIREKLVDINFINTLIEIVVNQCELDGYVQNIEFKKILMKINNGVSCASYNFMNRLLAKLKMSFF
ncbi:MAG: hypothetical protein IJR82_03595 [Bacilli bacterium]|nr:hypothetical protein [Bacilli bacterium]